MEPAFKISIGLEDVCGSDGAFSRKVSPVRVIEKAEKNW